MGEQALGRSIRPSRGLETPFGPATSPFEVDLGMFRPVRTKKKKKSAPTPTTLGTPVTSPFQASTLSIPFADKFEQFMSGGGSF